MKPTPNLLPSAIFQALATCLKRLAVICLVLGTGVLMAGSALDHEPIKPIPAGANLDAGKVLFHHPRLAQDDTISGASGHNLGRGGVDGRPRAVGIHQTELGINTPTALPRALLHDQDGRPCQGFPPFANTQCPPPESCGPCLEARYDDRS